MTSAYHRFLLMLIWLSLILLLSRPTLCETPKGTIEVTVTDPHGQVVVGSTVTYQLKSKGDGPPGTTNEQGFCVFVGLEAGAYSVTVEARGFKKSIKQKVEVTPAKTQRIPIQLEVGNASETVEVTAEASLIETQSTTLGSSFGQMEIQNTPILGRKFEDLLMLAPGVSIIQTDETFDLFSVNGNRARSNNFMVDGIDVNDSYGNTNGLNQPGSSGIATSVVPMEAFSQFRVSTHGFAADSGRNSGSIVDLTVKTGTNEIHGIAPYFFRNDALKARDFFNSVGPENKLLHNDFGVSVGGPFRRDKAFWFVAYEGRRERKEITTVSAVPRTSDFAQAILALGGSPSIPLEVNPVVNPVIRNLFALCRSSGRCPGGQVLWPQPTPNRANQVLNSLASAPVSNQSDGLVVKTDFILNERSHMEGYYSFGNAPQSLLLALAGGDALPRTNSFASSRSQVASVTHLLTTPNKVNELRVGWSRYDREFLDEDTIGIGNPAETIGLNTGVTNPRDFGLPHLVVRNFAFLGASPFSNPRGWDNSNWHIAERFTWATDRHTWNMGYEFRRVSIDSFDDVDFRGELEFSSLDDFLAGKVARGSILKGNSDRTTDQNSHALYVHDAFRLVSNLTLNFGVRWEYFGVLHEDKKLFSKYDPSQGLVIPAQLYERDLNNFSPRGGFAWSVDGRARTVLRAGAGVNFDAFPQNFFIGQIQFNTFNAGLVFNPISQSPILNSRSPTSVIKAGALVFPGASFSQDTRDAWTVAGISTPRVVSYNLNLQQEVLSSAVLEVAYVGSVGRSLFRTRDINAPLVPGASRPFDTAAILSPIAPNRPFIVNQLETSAASNYNSLQISFNQRRWHGLTNTVAWTWSHSIDDASDGIDSVPNMASPDNPHAPDRERASSNFDTRHKFTLASTYDLPKSIAPGRLGDGWQVAGILTLSSGQPYNVNFGDEFDSQGAYDFILRPDVVGNPLLGTAAPDRLLNLAAFQVPCTLDGHGTDVSNCLPGTLHFGNLPRNAFVAPGFKNLDLSISKTTALTEQLKLRIRAEFFNATNHPNFSSPLVPTFIARASLKGIDAKGRGGARGTGCNTAAASNDCYLPSTRTNGARSIQLSIRMIF